MTASLFGSVIINETYFETVESNYYNQAIELHNQSGAAVDLSSYVLLAGKSVSNVFTPSRTNQITSWSSSKQADFSAAYSNLAFTTLIPAGETAVILDNGYLDPNNTFPESFYFNNQVRRNTVYVLTASTGVLGTGNFMKDDDVLRLILADTGDIVDEFHNQTSASGYGAVKINPAKKGLPDNIASRPQTIGYLEDIHIHYTNHSPDRLSLDEVNGDVSVVGLPQVYNLTCKFSTAVSKFCNRSVSFNRHDFLKMYHYPKGSANLITASDEIVITAGQSAPITLFGLEPGLHKINTSDSSFPPVEKTISGFDHPQADKVYISEIYYNTNKNLTWLEVYSSSSLTLPLRIQTFNSDYKQNNDFDLGRVNLNPGYNVLGNRNPDFDRVFPSPESVIPITSQFAINTVGVITLSSEGKYLDIVHYDKNWFADFIDGRSLQRINLHDYAFTKAMWGVSTEFDTTPFSPNNLIRNISFTIDLTEVDLPLNCTRINFLGDFDTAGTLIAYLYDPNGYRIGKVFDQEVARGYRIPLFLCLKKVRERYGISPGEYTLMFLFDNSEGRKPLYRKFTLE